MTQRKYYFYYLDEPVLDFFNLNDETAFKSLHEKLKLKYEEGKGEAAFYAVKVDIQFKAVTGREETMSTIQLDFAAKKKFDLKFGFEQTGPCLLS